jgi:hypothetical protein
MVFCSPVGIPAVNELHETDEDDPTPDLEEETLDESSEEEF